MSSPNSGAAAGAWRSRSERLFQRHATGCTMFGLCSSCGTLIGGFVSAPSMARVLSTITGDMWQKCPLMTPHIPLDLARMFSELAACHSLIRCPGSQVHTAMHLRMLNHKKAHTVLHPWRGLLLKKCILLQTRWWQRSILCVYCVHIHLECLTHVSYTEN